MKVSIVESETAPSGKKLVIEVDLEKEFRQSSTGKSRLVATTSGNLKTDLQVNGEFLTVAVNAYIPNR